MTVTDQLPDADVLTWEITATTFGIASLSVGDFLTATSSTLQAGETTSITVSAIVPLDVVVPLSLPNTASVQADGMPSVPSSEAKITVSGTPRLEIVKAVNGPTMIHPGDTASFTVSVSNNTAIPLTNVTVTDQLPGADLLTWQISTSTFGIASLSVGDFLTATSSALQAGETTSITVSAIVPLDAMGLPVSLPNAATVHADQITAVTSNEALITVAAPQ